jgi:histidinol-phosphatase (PHP family)
MPQNVLIDVTGDHHVHTRYCNHASGEMEEYVHAALARGLRSLTFLEHLECGILYDHRTWLTPLHFKDYFREGRRLQQTYTNRISIRLGVEVGYNPDAEDELVAAVDRFPFDHIGLSYHYFFDGTRHLNMVSSRQHNLDALERIGVDQVLAAYFDGLIRAVKILPCQKICHLDAVLRHLPHVTCTQHNRQQIDRLLKIMAEKNIALEVNTSGFAHRQEPYPAGDIVTRALNLGIQLIAGSDAHRPDQVGRSFSKLSEFTR